MVPALKRGNIKEVLKNAPWNTLMNTICFTFGRIGGFRIVALFPAGNQTKPDLKNNIHQLTPTKTYILHNEPEET